MPKPRIRLFLKVWDCMLPDGAHTRIVGFGYTPCLAYKDWLRQMVQRGLM